MIEFGLKPVNCNVLEMMFDSELSTWLLAVTTTTYQRQDVVPALSDDQSHSGYYNIVCF